MVEFGGIFNDLTGMITDKKRSITGGKMEQTQGR